MKPKQEKHHPFNNKFEKVKRLLKKTEFDSVFRHRKVVRDGKLAIHNRPNGRTYSRLGLVVSRKVGNSVRRSRVKRLLREAFRLNQGKGLPCGFDLVCLPSPKYDDNTLQDVETRMLTLLNKLPKVAPRLYNE